MKRRLIFVRFDENNTKKNDEAVFRKKINEPALIKNK